MSTWGAHTLPWSPWTHSGSRGCCSCPLSVQDPSPISSPSCLRSASSPPPSLFPSLPSPAFVLCLPVERLFYGPNVRLRAPSGTGHEVVQMDTAHSGAAECGRARDQIYALAPRSQPSYYPLGQDLLVNCPYDKSDCFREMSCLKGPPSFCLFELFEHEAGSILGLKVRSGNCIFPLWKLLRWCQHFSCLQQGP